MVAIPVCCYLEALVAPGAKQPDEYQEHDQSQRDEYQDRHENPRRYQFLGIDG